MVSKAQVKKIVLSFPGAEEGLSYGYPSYKVAGKFFTRLRDEDDSLVLFVDSIDERDLLLEADPELFHITTHYKDYPTVLARLTKLDAKTLRGMLERRWRKIAPKKLAKDAPARNAGAKTHSKRR
ncbi:MAG: MmcQ/YjbR family DNA-binding protein [Alphaproteobacteria bacterium]|nr:MmcQ/YjbR family DNA-binding protein [Alphaproteobacteria bacterium]